MAFYHDYQQQLDYQPFPPFPLHPFYQNGPYGPEVAGLPFMPHQGMMQGTGGKTTESKPRLAKDEVDKLEREFQKNNKPNSSLKKQLAEEMNVDIARINNWFQNRRAKAKQERRAQENEARRKTEQSADASTAVSDTVKEYYPSKDQEEDLRPSAAPFPPASAPAETPVIRESQTAEETDSIDGLEDRHQTTEGSESDHASPESTIFHAQDVDITYSLANTNNFFSGQPNCDFSSSFHEETSQAPSLTLSIPSEFMAGMADPTSASSFSSYQHTSASTDMDEVFAPHYMSASLPDSVGLHNLKREQLQSEDMSRFQQFSPQSMSHSPPEIATIELPFKPTPTIDIASRRNSKRPAQLVNCSRSQSYNFSGPKTGYESRRVEAPSPMRRVASATGNFPRGVQKATSAGLRSPSYFDHNRENLILQMASHSPVSRNSVAPPTPNTPVVPTQQNMREATVSSMSSDEDKTYSVQTSLMVPHPTDPTLRTPPDTPGLLANMPNTLYSTSFEYNVPDEPLLTPGGYTEFSLMPANIPAYVNHGCLSQPVTPSFPSANIGPAFCSAPFSGGNTEYNWSDGQSVSAKPSPDHLGSRELQFTNLTAHDFTGRE
ncbi:homeobox domain-containing protein [Colletotrichum musicola]|uniref:Homeobox domain-containing protein n=1 Tax=Colletotrichum musicola TaxID=2175873 RepID=A0A8H6J2H9_9PEZI|nr:homeobox domain-containing protein [Colletotrichum musicola]